MSAPPPTSQSDPFEGTQYRVLEALEGGGMAEVFLVEHRHLERRFVAKVLRPALALMPQMVDRMRLEAQTLGRISHANIVAITNFGLTSDGRPFIVMEQLRGRTVRAELMEHGAFPVASAIRYACELLEGLRAAHELGVVHRDIKPDNLFLAESPGHQPTLKILDFGIARVLPDAAAEAPMPLTIPTATGHIVGTPRFLSPEGATGATVDTRADLYGAALVLYTMLSGRGPFDHVESDEDLRIAHSVEEPVPPSSYARGPVPVELDRLVLRALEKDPDARFQTAVEFRAELEHVATLLGQPAGWLDTTAFDASAFELVASSLNDRDAPAQKETTEPSRSARDASSADERREAAAPHQVPAANASMSPRMLGLLFLIGVVCTTLIALALATLVSSR
jgi:serine/threonine protein kinase